MQPDCGDDAALFLAQANEMRERVGSLGDNTKTTFLDTRDDDDLMQPSSDTVTGAATPAGSTTLTVGDLSKFQANGGWVFCAGQSIRYTGRAASSGEGNLTGIPASGDGAILADIPAGTSVVNDGILTGVSGLTTDIAAGTTIRVLVMHEDTTAQTTLAALEGGDGIHEHILDAGQTATYADCVAAASGDLDDFDGGEDMVRWTSRDPSTITGRSISVSLTTPSVVGDFEIQSATWTGFEDAGPTAFPLIRAEGGRTRLTVADLLRMVQQL